MFVALGVDTLCYHCRIEAGDISLEDVLRESAEVGASFVQLHAHHLRGHSSNQVELLRGSADALDLDLTMAGGVIGVAGSGDTVVGGSGRVAEWLRLAELVGSPYVRMSSGFYRADLWREPERIAAEHRYVIEALNHAADRNDTGISMLLENHSDFTPDEYMDIITQVGPDRVGVFLDLINPVSVLMDPLPVVKQLFPLAPAGHVKDFRLESEYVEDGFHRRGFAVKWCYPGEGVADIGALVGVLASSDRLGRYLLSVEGLDNRADIADQRDRIAASFKLLRTLIPTDSPA